MFLLACRSPPNPPAPRNPPGSHSETHSGNPSEAPSDNARKTLGRHACGNIGSARVPAPTAQ
eukprot:1752994-Alexandrium_andersonii.AAC.1